MKTRIPLKWVFLNSLIVFTMDLSAQNSGHGLFQSISESRSTFNSQVRQDSLLSLKSEKGFIPSLLHNLGYQATSPLRMKEKHFFLLGACTFITVSLIQFDQQIDDNIRPVKKDEPFVNTTSPEISELGNYYGYLFLAGYAGYGLIFHKYKAFRTSLLATQAVISAGLWIRIGKILSGRMRPSATYNDPEYNSDHWFGPFAEFKSEYNANRGQASFDAFPSGHTGTAFAIATVFSEEFKEYKALPVTLYSIATLVGVSRLVEHAHWASDVFLGAVVGYLCGKQVANNDHRLFPQYSIAHRKIKSTFFPVNFAGVNGIGWKLVF